MLKQVYITLIGVLFVLSAKAQLQVHNFFSLTGKKDISIKVISENLSGEILFGTGEGIFVFDGNTCKAFLENETRLKKEISALFVDEQNRFWIGTKDGLVYTYAKSSLDSVNFGKPDNTSKITCFVQSQQGMVIGTYGNGVYSLKDGKLKHFTTDNGLSDNVIYSMAADELGNIWCGSDAGINVINKPFSEASFDLFANKNGLPDNIVRHLKLINNKLLVSMQDSGICFIDINQNRIERLPFVQNWKEGTVLQADQIDPYKYVIVTENKGLYQIINGIFYHYNYDELTQSSSINHVFIDHTKQIWLAGKKGLSQYCEKRFNVINKEKGLSEEKILALAVDDYSNVWVGTTTGISKIENIDAGELKETKVQSLDKFTISCATKAPDGNIWFGTYGNGIIIMSARSTQNVILNSKDDQLPNDNISDIYFAGDSTVYVSTLGGGLIKVHVELQGEAKLFKVVKNYTQANDGLGNDYVYHVITDRKGKLYVATDGGGLNVLENGKFVNLSKKHHLRSNTFYSLCCDKNNKIWASSNGEGIVSFDGEKFKVFNQNQGIRDLQPQQMIAIKDYLYLVNSKGIDKINIESGEVTYCDLVDKDFEPNLNAVCKFRNKILSGTNLGILVYRTDKNKIDSIKPRVLIHQILVNFKAQKADSAFEFHHTQNNFSIAFKGVWLQNPKKLTFRYRLNGLEENWIYADEAKTVNYNNLKPGNYNFIVQVKNDEEIWSDPESYSFIILTPLWQRWWFWPLLILSVIVGAYSFVRYRLRLLQRENLLLEEKVSLRTKEIEKQRKIIEEKNKDITDSIAYAKKIQDAILPKQSYIHEHLPHAFVLYLTKDIVSGDFYFFSHFGKYSIIAAIDCTGHGVPGAFMSMIGYNQLNHIINENKISDPATILFELNKGVISVIHKNESESKDGMDVAICKINHDDLSLEYAGAMRPLWLVNKNGLTEIKADKIPIGTKADMRDNEIKYHTHKIEHQTDNHFYIFTDGYADQFGGPDTKRGGKKFSTGKFKELLLSKHQLAFAKQEQDIKETHLAWKGNCEQVDDILVIGFKI